MQKEIVIVLAIVIVIVTLDVLTQNYTKNSFLNINIKLDEIKEIGELLEKGEASDEKKEKLTKKIEELKNEWKLVNKRTAFYIEHDELEKVNTSMTKFKSYFELAEYTEAIPELENCKYILNHIKEKEAMQIINLF